MAFSSAFISAASNPWGEMLQVRLYVRLNDGVGGTPSTLVTVTTDQSVISLNPVNRKRDLEFGVIKGQSWQVRVTNIDLALLAYDFKGCWAAIYGGFPVEDEWAIFAQGKIAKFSASTDGTVTLEVQDTVMDLLNFTMPRDINFQDTGWISEVRTVAKASGSGSWSSSTALTLNTAASADDETFVIEFTGSNTYKVILENGDETQTGLTSASKTIYNAAGDTNIITIPTAGWGSGTFTSGDKFEFFTARARTTNELTPIYMIEHLIDDIAGTGAYDVLTGAAYSSVRFDTTNWTSLGEDHKNKEIGGEWRKGTRISSLIQDAMKLVHGSIFPTATGQVAVWAVGPADAAVVELNGNPGSGPVDIISASVTDDIGNMVSEVTYEYFDLDGNEASYTANYSSSELLEPRGKVVTIGWRVDGASLEDAADKYVLRFGSGAKIYDLKTTLVGVLADIGEAVNIVEGELDITGQMADTTDIALDLINNSAAIKAHTDPLILDTYFILANDDGSGGSLLDGTDVLR